MGGIASLPLKRGWRGLVVAVLVLVIFSMLVPLVFLLGLHNGFHSAGYLAEVGDSDSGVGPRSFDSVEPVVTSHHLQGDHLRHVDSLLKRFEPNLPKDVIENLAKDVDKETVDGGLVTAIGEPKNTNLNSGATESHHIPPVVALEPLPDTKTQKHDGKIGTDYVKGVSNDETQKSCQLEFGSYCVWRKEHKQEMRDKMVKKMKDQLFVARAYYPTIAKLPAQDKLSREMKQNIQEYERIFSEVSTDAELPLDVEKKLHKMEGVIEKAKSFPVDCNNVDKKLRQILDMTEDEAHFHMKQSAFLYQLAVQTKPKSHHCLSMRLTVEYFRSSTVDTELLQDKKHGNPALYHYVIFSNNVLASSVVINSTVMHAKESEKLVFHLVTDGQNYVAMKHWFLRNRYRNVTITVMNIEDLNRNYLDGSDVSNLYYSDEFRVSVRSTDKPTSIQMKTEYISLFGPAHFLLPEIFQNLERVVVLDDDVVVQQDLSPLWSLEMEGKVNGAVEYCGVRFGQLKSYLEGNSYDNNSCAWMSGLNVIDLKKWRELNLTEKYRRLLHTQLQRKGGKALARVAALSANMLTFQNQIYALDSSWALSGLGHDYGIDIETFKNAAVLHYNGNMKPWLDLAIPNYKAYWTKFLKRDDQYMDECNISP